MPAVTHCKLPRWLDPGRKPDAKLDLGALKAALSDRGVNGRGWRLYLDYGDAIFDPLGEPWVDDELPLSSALNALAWLRLLQACEMDVLPPPEVVASVADWSIPGQRLEEIPPHFLRAVWKSAVAAQYEEQSLAEFIRREVIPVSEWLFGNAIHIDADPALFRSTWPALVRRATVASARQQRLVAGDAASIGQDEWNPYVRRVEWGRFTFLALTTAAQLKEEGEAMNHCVGDYAENCCSGITRIYSVRERRSGKRVATCSLELVTYGPEGYVWEHDQVQGSCNSEVSPDVRTAVDAVLRSYFELPLSCFQIPKALAWDTMFP